MLAWIGYCFVHSFLANSNVKEYFSRLMGTAFKYYRISYSLFAALTLILLLYFQFTISSYFLFESGILKILSIIIFVIPGLLLMAVCIKKYFYELSGVQALNNEPLQITLQVNGLHKYVRHPLYSGTLLFAWGLFLIFPSLANLIACFIMLVYVLIGIRLEEQQLRKDFGEKYINYSKKVPMLIPRVF